MTFAELLQKYTIAQYQIQNWFITPVYNGAGGIDIVINWKLLLYDANDVYVGAETVQDTLSSGEKSTFITFVQGRMTAVENATGWTAKPYEPEP
jgi:hypothetical protein